MRKLMAVWFLASVSAFALLQACSRETTVHAGGDSDGYQPLPSGNLEIQGTLKRVNIGQRNIVVELENGLEQTFEFNDNTAVLGLHRVSRNGDRSVAQK